MKVYIVHECVDGEDRIYGVYGNYEKAREDVEEILSYAEYESREGDPPDFWSFGEDCISIEVYDVIQ